MNQFLIIKDNLVTNKTLGYSSLSEGETAVEATGSNSKVSKGDYYLPSSQTYYSPINADIVLPEFEISGSDEGRLVLSVFEGIVSSSLYTITINYPETINPTPSLSNLSSEDVTISNFSANSSSFNFDVAVTDQFVTTSLEQTSSKVNITFDHNNITDTNNNALYSPSSNGISTYHIEYTGSI